MNTVVLPVRTMRLIGVKLLIVTNAAGGLNPDYNVGDVMVIQDHFGMPCIAGIGPLTGHNDDKLGPRFVSTSDAFDDKLQDIVMKIANENQFSKSIRTNGTYCFVSGPAYESKAECRFLRFIGGDSVGMSTVPEILAAKHCGMKILGLSLITNKVVFSKDDNLVPASHAEVLQAVEESGKRVELIVKSFVLHKDLKDYLMQLRSFKYISSSVAAGSGTILTTSSDGDDTNIKTRVVNSVSSHGDMKLIITATLSAIIGASIATLIVMRVHHSRH